MTPKDMTAALKDAPLNEWIALSKDQTRIVGKGKTIEEAIAAAKQAGEKEPFVTKAPPQSASFSN